MRNHEEQSYLRKLIADIYALLYRDKPDDAMYLAKSELSSEEIDQALERLSKEES